VDYPNARKAIDCWKQTFLKHYRTLLTDSTWLWHRVDQTTSVGL